MHDIFRMRNKTQVAQSLKINILLKKRGLMVYVLIVKGSGLLLSIKATYKSRRE